MFHQIYFYLFQDKQMSRCHKQLTLHLLQILLLLLLHVALHLIKQIAFLHKQKSVKEYLKGCLMLQQVQMMKQLLLSQLPSK